jgi:Pectate lyase superfamily protein
MGDSVDVMKFVMVIAMLVGCERAPISRYTSAIVSTPAVNVMDYGATGDGVTDDRVAVQAALTAGAGGDVYFPDGTYLLARGPGFWCVTVPADTSLRGQSRDGTVLKQAGGVAGSVRLLEIDHPDVLVHRMTLDGNKTEQTADEHRAGIFASGAVRLVVSDVTARNFTGDGFYVYAGANDTSWINVSSTGNVRNGITFGGGSVGGVVSGSEFRGNLVQQLDSEPKNGNTVDGLTISDSIFDGDGVSGDYVITVAGSGAAARSSDWSIVRSVINGSVQIAWAQDVVLARNVGVNPTTKPAVRVYRRSDGIAIVDNTLSLSGAAGQVIDVTGTGAGQMPDHVLIARNTLSTGTANAHGVNILNARNTTVTDNIMTGSGVAAAFVSGVRVKASVPLDPIQSATVTGNRISNFGQWGVSLASASGAQILTADISDNTFVDDDAPASMLSALSLDDGAHAARDVRTRGNALVGGCVTMTSTVAPGAYQVWGDRWLMP